jgi:hypothetical protein
VKYLRYDSLRGPLPSEQQPNEEDLSVMGAVKVVGRNRPGLYELFTDPQCQVWAKQVEPREQASDG